MKGWCSRECSLGDDGFVQPLHFSDEDIEPMNSQSREVQFAPAGKSVGKISGRIMEI